MSDHFKLDFGIDRRGVPAAKVHPSVLGAGGEGLFAAGVADMDFPVPPAVQDALRKRLDHDIYGYEMVPDGLIPAVIGWMRDRHGWRIEKDHVLRAPNVLNPLALAVSLFSEAGEGVIVQPPVFFDFFDVLRENGRKVVQNPLILDEGRYRMDFEGLEAKASDPRTKILFLCNPHNPVGRVWRRDELRRLGDICARHGVLVVSDEIHGDLIFDGHAFTPFAGLGPEYAANAVICLSPAKTFNIPACSAAFTVIADARRRAAFQAENSRLTVNKNNAFANVAMEAAYREGGPWLDAVLAYLTENLAMLRLRLAPLQGVAMIEPEGTFLVWLDFRALGLSPEALTAFLRDQAGWAITKGERFGIEGGGFARLNIATQRHRLSTALDQLEQALMAHAAG